MSVLLCSAVGPAAAQEGPRISVGDVLRVDVGARTDLGGQYTVSDNGTITIPRVGTIRAQGKSPAELAEDISRRLSLVDRDIPKVSVTILESRTKRIFVLGAVLIPGSYTFATPPTPWDAITLAGGAEEDADLAAVEIIPAAGDGGRTTTTIDLVAALREGRLGEADKLRPGDTVRVPRKGAAAGGVGLVHIFGAVRAQGDLPLDQAPDLMSAVLKAGGPSEAADLRKIDIVRRDGARYQHLAVNLEDYVGRSDPGGNVPLRSGDTIRVPARESQSAKLLRLAGIMGTLLGLSATIVTLSNH